MMMEKIFSVLQIGAILFHFVVIYRRFSDKDLSSCRNGLLGTGLQVFLCIVLLKQLSEEFWNHKHFLWFIFDYALAYYFYLITKEKRMKPIKEALKEGLTPIKKAFEEYGVKEIEGRGDHPQIIRYFNEIGYDGEKLKDETAWCSAFANWVAKITGYEYSGRLNARSWLKVGEKVEEPQFGDVVVLWREKRKSWNGHVGFYVRQTNRYIYILGGNQRNSVCIKAYSKERLLEYRRLSKIRNNE
jgi:uncharacterized protein (TIGR02594 family)